MSVDPRRAAPRSRCLLTAVPWLVLAGCGSTDPALSKGPPPAVEASQESARRDVSLNEFLEDQDQAVFLETIGLFADSFPWRLALSSRGQGDLVISVGAQSVALPFSVGDSDLRTLQEALEEEAFFQLPSDIGRGVPCGSIRILGIRNAGKVHVVRLHSVDLESESVRAEQIWELARELTAPAFATLQRTAGSNHALDCRCATLLPREGPTNDTCQEGNDSLRVISGERSSSHPNVESSTGYERRFLFGRFQDHWAEDRSLWLLLTHGPNSVGSEILRVEAHAIFNADYGRFLADVDETASRIHCHETGICFDLTVRELNRRPSVERWIGYLAYDDELATSGISSALLADGLFASSYPSGEALALGRWLAGAKEGRWIVWRLSGRPLFVLRYAHGLLDGPCGVFDEDGSLDTESSTRGFDWEPIPTERRNLIKDLLPGISWLGTGHYTAGKRVRALTAEEAEGLQVEAELLR